MKFTEEFGVKLDSTVKKFLARGIEREGNQSKFARAVGATDYNVSNWLGEGKRKGEFITWDQWVKIREYLIKVGDISPADVLWMPPSVLREIMIKQRDMKIVNNGTNSGVIGIKHETNPCAGEVEAFRSALLQGIIDLEIDDAAKVIILRFVRDFRRK